MGGCGRPLCCASFLGDFEPVSIRMAKEQNLSLNPAKISGICGRLMCCLKFENECYCERFPKKERPKPPSQGSRVVTMEGEGRVISLNMQRRSATILLDDSKRRHLMPVSLRARSSWKKQIHTRVVSKGTVAQGRTVIYRENHRI